MTYKLIWSDEFNDKTLDQSKWVVETGDHGAGNAENQIYTSREKNVRLEDNKLIIEAHKEDFETFNYTSAKLTTFGKLDLQYGKISVRAKIPAGKGSWPAIWMLPNAFRNGEKWPGCGEIDIMEHVGRDEDMMHFSLHTGAYNHKLKNQLTYFERFSSITNRFAEYTMLWDGKSIEFLVDDVSYAKFVKGQEGMRTDKMGWPFDEPYYLILNLAVGGYWGGAVDDSIFPIKLEFDYVRVYKKQ